MYKQYCGLIMRCARLRVRVTERAICQTAQTILWFAENTYTNHSMVWSKERHSGQLGVRNMPVGCATGLGFGAGGPQVGEKGAFGRGLA